MRTPDLFIIDEQTHEVEKLTRIEAAAEAANFILEDVAERVCEALDRFVVDHAGGRLTELQNELIILAISAKNAQETADDAVRDIFSKIRGAVQDLWRSNKYHFDNDDIFSVFGRKQEVGVISEVNYHYFIKTVDEGGHVPDNSRSPELDKDYAIDHVTAWFDTGEDHMDARKIDLVQVKSRGKNVRDLTAEQILEKHKRFFKDKKVALQAFREPEVPEGILTALKVDLGEELAGSYIGLNWLEALTDGDPVLGQERFRDFLEDFKKDVYAHPAFARSSKALKRAFVLGLEVGVEPGGDEGIKDNLNSVFNSWKKEWVESLNVKKERVFEPIQKIEVRSVIYSAEEQSREVQVLGTLD